jgi:pyruvate formate lyase activating enzyme
MITPQRHATKPELAAPTRRFAGWLPAGMLDWPGRLTTTIFLGGCDFRCPFCHNGQLVAEPDRSADWGAFVTHLDDKRDWLDGVVITGGEPTTDPGLRTLLEALAEMRLPVKLDTNGNHPELIAEFLADGLVAFVALDVKTVAMHYGALTGVEGAGGRVTRTAGILIGSGVAHEFRTTAYPGAVALDDLVDIARLLEGGDRYVIQQFKPDNAMDPRASSVLPYRADALVAAASLCDKHLPTTLRGV